MKLSFPLLTNCELYCPGNDSLLAPSLHPRPLFFEVAHADPAGEPIYLPVVDPSAFARPHLTQEGTQRQLTGFEEFAQRSRILGASEDR